MELVREALEEHGTHGELIVLSDGESAIEFVHYLDAQSGKCPDLLILDLNLPKRSGREVLECLRRSAACGASPVLVLARPMPLRTGRIPLDSAPLGIFANRPVSTNS